MASDRLLEAEGRPCLGLALSGGGARGLAHIGVLKVLERARVPIHCLAGTSMGGVIAAAYASGLSPQQLEEEAIRLGRPRGALLRLADPGLPDGGLLRGQRLQAYFEARLGGRTFADLRCPLALIAVDLNTRREVVMREGSLALALRATTAVPGLITPLEVEGRRLVDGGLLNNLPVDAARDLGATLIVAVDVTPAAGQVAGRFAGARLPEGLLRTLIILDEAISLMIAALQEHKLSACPPDVLIRPRVPEGVNLLMGYQRAGEVVEAGERAAQEALPQILEACARKGVALMPSR